jgi:tagaturonate reductase
MSREEATAYAESVRVRFSNPYIKHYLAAISLNSVSKFRVRVLPSILAYMQKFGKKPTHLLFSFAKLIEFYKKGTPNDAHDIMAYMKEASVADILSNRELWGEDLSALIPEVESYANS